MRSLSSQLAFYRSYHRTAGCKATHVFGVPLVTFAILIPMGWIPFHLCGYRISPAWLFVAGTLGYYFLLEPILATWMTLIMIPFALGADWVARLPFPASAWVFALTFVTGWILQLLGHAIEGKRPALLDNFSQAVFTAPLFLLAEMFPWLRRRFHGPE
jgi:uncharacterized membrane protein YGL010W